MTQTPPGLPRWFNGFCATGTSAKAVEPLGQAQGRLCHFHPRAVYLHVRPGRSVEITLDGISDRTVIGTVEKIRPRSEIRDGHNVFVAEVIVPNEDQQLRPGMRGQADIATSAHPLAWNLFHKAWDALWRSAPAAFLAESKVGVPQNGAVQLARRPRDDEAELERRSR